MATGRSSRRQSSATGPSPLIHNPGNIMKKTLLCSALLAALMSVSGANAAIVFQDNIGLIGTQAGGFSFSFDTTNKTISTSTGSLNSGWTAAYIPPYSYSYESETYTYPAEMFITPVNTGPTTYGAGAGYAAGTNPFFGSINYSASVQANTSPSYMALTAYNTVGQVYTGWASFTSSSDGSAFQLNAIAFNDFATTINTYQSAITIGNTGNGMYVAPTYVANVAAPSAVPIPAAAWLMTSGLGALGVAARKRKAQ
jgi:hypothetical protein